MSRGDCRCVCVFWNHRGLCTGDAVTTLTFELEGEPVAVPCCRPCAVDIAEATAVVADDPADMESFGSPASD